MKLRTRLRRRFRRANQRIAALDIRKLFAIALICVALDTGTVFLHFTLRPSTFSLVEQNELFRWALVSGHVEGYLVAESIKVMAAVTVFALASWFAVFRFSMVGFIMVTMLAISSNLNAIVARSSMNFIALQIVAFCLICVGLGKSIMEGWFKK